jgi:hypothetical protein
MKALQIKYFGPTNTRGTRLKLSVEGFPAVYESRDYSVDVAEQALAMADSFIAKNDFPAISGIGSINGVYYVTVGGVK